MQCRASAARAQQQTKEHFRRAHLSAFPVGLHLTAAFKSAAIRGRSKPGPTAECCVAVADGLGYGKDAWSTVVWAKANSMAIDMVDVHHRAVADEQREPSHSKLLDFVAETIAARIYICSVAQSAAAHSVRATQMKACDELLAAPATRPSYRRGRRPRVPGVRRKKFVDTRAEIIARDWLRNGVPDADDRRQTAAIERLLDSPDLGALLAAMASRGALASIHKTMAEEQGSEADEY